MRTSQMADKVQLGLYGLIVALLMNSKAALNVTC